MVKAVALLTGTQNANGTVTFSQQGTGPTTTDVNLSEFSPGLYELVVHVHGDITNRSKSTGIAFKDLGSIYVDDDGKGHLKRDYNELPVIGEDSIIGRAFVVHAGGSAGPAVVWGLGWPNPGLGGLDPGLGRPDPFFGWLDPGLGRPGHGLGLPGPGFGRLGPGFSRPGPGFGRPGPGLGRPAPGFGRPRPCFGRPRLFGPPYSSLSGGIAGPAIVWVFAGVIGRAA